MALLKNITATITAFFVGLITTLVMLLIIPPVLNAVEDMITNSGTTSYNDWTQIIWGAVIFIWILMTLGVPNYYFIQGLQDIKEAAATNKLMAILLAISIAFFSLLLTYKGWFIITGLGEMTDNGLITILYWAGIIMYWVEITLIVPTYLIMCANTKGE